MVHIVLLPESNDSGMHCIVKSGELGNYVQIVIWPGNHYGLMGLNGVNGAQWGSMGLIILSKIGEKTVFFCLCGDL